MAFSAAKPQLQLKLLMLWIAVAFGHLGHTTSHYLDSKVPEGETAHHQTNDAEHSHEHEHEHSEKHESNTCVTCIAFALVALELSRSPVGPVKNREILSPEISPSQTEHTGMTISKRPGRPRAPPLAA